MRSLAKQIILWSVQYQCEKRKDKIRKLYFQYELNLRWEIYEKARLVYENKNIA